jgi:hypothetical protein
MKHYNLQLFAAPQAPLPLSQQIQAGGSIVVTVPLQALGSAPGFTVGGATFNNGNPNATYTIAIANASTSSTSFQALCELLDELQRNGNAVVT